MILRKVSSFEPNIFIKVILYQDLCHLFLSMALNASSLRMGSFINCSILIFPLLVCGSSAQILVTLGVVLFSFNSFTPRMFGCGDLYLWHLLSSAVHLVLHLQHIVKLFLCQLPLSRMIEPMTKVKKNQLNNNWFVKWNLIKLRKGLNIGNRVMYSPSHTFTLNRMFRLAVLCRCFLTPFLLWMGLDAFIILALPRLA